ncbi:NADH dehydrogenase I chain C; chain D [Salmonella enterica subsp. enterica]|nr:NADH dehydrogenase I chain C; chain D [Salmonella enterica subsp. enterica]
MVNNMTDLTAQDAAWSTRDHLDDPVIGELRNRFGRMPLPFRRPAPVSPLFGSSVNNYWRLAIS